MTINKSGKIKSLFWRAGQKEQKHRFDVSVDFIELKNDSNTQVKYDLARNSRVITSSEQAQLWKGRAYFKNPLVVDLTLYCKKNKQEFEKKIYFFIFYKIYENKKLVIGKTKIDFSQFVSTSSQLYKVSFVILKNKLNCGTAHLKVRCGNMGGGARGITAASVDSGEEFPSTRSCSLPPGGGTSSGETNEASENDSDGGGNGSGSGSMAGNSFFSEEINGAYTWEDNTTNSERANNWSGKGEEYDRPISSRDNSIGALKRSIDSSLQKLTRMNGRRWHHRSGAPKANGVTMQEKPIRGVPMAHTNEEKGATESGNPPRTEEKTQTYHLQRKINRRKNKKEANHPALEVQSVIRNMEKAIKNGEMIQRMNRSILRQSDEEGVTEGGHTTRRTQIQTPTRRYDGVNKMKERPNQNGINSTGRQVQCRPQAEQNGQSSHPSNYNMHFVMEEKNGQIEKPSTGEPPTGEPPNEEPPIQNNFHHTCGELRKMNWTLGHNLVQRCDERDEHLEPSMMALRHLLLISAQSAHEWDDYQRLGSYATPLRLPHDGCTVSRTREEVYRKGLPPCWEGRNYNDMAKNGMERTNQMSTHFTSIQFPIGAPTHVACPHSYAMREEGNFLFVSVNGRGPIGGEMENLLDLVGRDFSKTVDRNWRGVTREGINTRGTNLHSDFAPNGLPNRVQRAQFSSQQGCLFKKPLSGEGATPPHDDHADVHSNEGAASIHSKIKKISSEENKTINELVTIDKLVEDMQKVQLVIKELTGTLVRCGHRGVSSHGDPNTTEQAHFNGGNTISLFSPPSHGGPKNESAIHDGNESYHNLSSGDVQKYEEKIATLVQELMDTKLLLAESETKREEDINEMNRRGGS
ncbi:hypothetical protein C922_02531 [Plasmodium inui San Antonio 1]|uniref:C2 NT-type domain-containing protein n=1 Tax=Plasmodium inui San Antonio 1 TaxID=1237626 RepID=W7A151_9APIC|nr:hypothetical protein C922_02531 [Plasmodium inui San Antonio 1]EUD66947.1 hypothetical protein C922_02531 [Plasmodium inui San Antonio 1]